MAAHVLFAASNAKSVGVGLIDRPVRVIGAPPVLVKVNVLAVLVWPTRTEPKLAGAAELVVGLTLATGRLWPERTTSCGPALVRIVRVALLGPAAGV